MEKLVKKEIFGLFLTELAEALKVFDIPSYRAKQIVEWIYQKGEIEFAGMTNLPKKLRTLLEAHFSIGRPEVLAEQHSKDGKTSKFLLGLADGHAIETVLMRQPYGNSVCVSSQVGCAMGCVFCASTINGVVRNLTAGEMLAQVFHSQRLLKNQGGVNSIVIMGSGEPLANYDEVLSFIRLCHEEYCLHMSYRNITLSTSGLVPEIRRLAEEGLPINLSISLHAPTNALRSSLMPVNRRYPIEELIAAASYYASVTGRRITYEYTLVKGSNDTMVHARQLAALIKGQLANVNLIPVNPVNEKGVVKPDGKTVEEFEKELKRLRINVTVRKEMGADIQAACGQLRHQKLTEQYFPG